MERAIAQPHPGGCFPGRFEAGLFQHAAGQGQRAFGAQPSRAGSLPFGGADVVTALPGHAQRRVAGVLLLVLGQHGVQQDAGQDVVTALRDAHPEVRLRRLVHLRGPADPAGRLVTRAQRSGVDELIQVERGQLAGDPDCGRRLVPGYRPPGGADERVHATPQIVIKRRDGPDRGIRAHGYRITPASVSLKQDLTNQRRYDQILLVK
jgi:hypothetical protein